jgi:hypothetical protein
MISAAAPTTFLPAQTAPSAAPMISAAAPTTFLPAQTAPSAAPPASLAAPLSVDPAPTASFAVPPQSASTSTPTVSASPVNVVYLAEQRQLIEYNIGLYTEQRNNAIKRLKSHSIPPVLREHIKQNLAMINELIESEEQNLKNLQSDIPALQEKIRADYDKVR